MLVEALVAELAVEAFDVAVLRRAARFDQDVHDTVLLRPGDEGAAGELRHVVIPRPLPTCQTRKKGRLNFLYPTAAL